MQIRRLHHHKLGNPTGATFDHGSIIGIMQYFQGRFRPDITFAVNLVDKYTKSKKSSNRIRANWYIPPENFKGLFTTHI